MSRTYSSTSAKTHKYIIDMNMYKEGAWFWGRWRKQDWYSAAVTVLLIVTVAFAYLRGSQ